MDDNRLAGEDMAGPLRPVRRANPRKRQGSLSMVSLSFAAAGSVLTFIGLTLIAVGFHWLGVAIALVIQR